MRTRLTELLDIEFPVMLAGMGGVSYHHLVAAVSEAGGLGTLGASTTWGTSAMVATVPVWPPPSVPCATTKSHPLSYAAVA